MCKKLGLIALAALAFGFVPRSKAGTEVITDYSAQAPPPPIYYAPPAVRVVVYQPPPVRVYGYQRLYVRRAHWHPRCR